MKTKTGYIGNTQNDNITLITVSVDDRGYLHQTARQRYNAMTRMQASQSAQYRFAPVLGAIPDEDVMDMIVDSE